MSSVAHAGCWLSLVLVLAGASALAVVLAALCFAWETFLFIRAGRTE